MNIQPRDHISEPEKLQLVNDYRKSMQQTTCCASTAAEVSIMLLATFLMDAYNQDVELVAKEMQRVKNEVVSQLRSGKISLVREKLDG